MQYSFVFDTNKCVGCQACAVACSVENGGKAQINWREIQTYNRTKHPDLPLFHFSLACNHCEEAPCMKACPALAYSRNSETGAVIINQNSCIGCTYCTWACPYDAPKFNKSLGVIEKCTFCNHRILENKQPACVNLCPTGALGFEEKFPGVDNSKIFGFIEKEIKPSIRIIELREKESLPQEVLDAMPKYSFDPKLINKPIINPKLSFKKDWTLALFTLLAGILFGSFAAAFWGNVQLNKWIFPAVGGVGMLFSTMHLGKKFRAWRAVSNVLNSWLSREIFFFSLFWFASAAWLWFENLYVGQVAILSGFLALVSIDMVYTVSEKTTPSRLHSAHTVLTGFFMAGVLLENEYLWGFTGGIKLILYVYRKLYLREQLTITNVVFSGLRIIFMLILPMAIWHFLNTQGFNLILISLVLGEIIDRADFYNELYIITPKSYLLEKEQLN